MFELFSDVCPQTERQLKTSGASVLERREREGTPTNLALHYLNTPIHRIVKGFIVQGRDFSSGESSVKIYRGPSPKIMTTLSQGIYEVVPNPIDLTPLYIYSYRQSCHHGCNFFTIQYMHIQYTCMMPKLSLVLKFYISTTRFDSDCSIVRYLHF